MSELILSTNHTIKISTKDGYPISVHVKNVKNEKLEFHVIDGSDSWHANCMTVEPKELKLAFHKEVKE